MAGQTLEPGEMHASLKTEWQKDAEKVFLEQFWLVKNDVTETRTYHDAEDRINEK